MSIEQAGMVVIALSLVAVAFSICRLAGRLHRTADALDALLHTSRHQLELTAEQTRQTLQQISATGETVDTQVKKMEKMVVVTENVLESVRLTSIVIQRAIASPIAGLSGVVAGVAKGLGTIALKRSKGEKA